MLKRTISPPVVLSIGVTAGQTSSGMKPASSAISISIVKPLTPRPLCPTALVLIMLPFFNVHFSLFVSLFPVFITLGYAASMYS